MAPSHISSYRVFNVTNVFTPTILEFLQSDDFVYASSTSVRVMWDSWRRPQQCHSRELLTLLQVAMSRHRLRFASIAVDVVTILATLALTVMASTMGDFAKY